jgi:hypothetical protein
VADRTYWLGLLEEGMHEVYCFVAATQVVRAYGAPRYDQTVVFIGGDL